MTPPQEAQSDAEPVAFHIGAIPIRGRTFLSPMAGFSDLPFRSLCRTFGAGFSFTEFVSADALARRSARDLKLLDYDAAVERPILFQIFGSEVAPVLEAGRVVKDLGPDVLDLNMGCSVQRVSQRGAGAGLLRNLPTAARMIEQLNTIMDIPVTAKIRLGWDDKTRNHLETVRVLQESGVAMISVHGRTRDQAYRGQADWDAIAEIKAYASVPILGNGDVTSAAEAEERRKASGVDGVLIGRGAIGNPWIFRGEDVRTKSLTERKQIALAHFKAMDACYDRAHILFRKHANRYFQGTAPEFVECRKDLLKCADSHAVLATLGQDARQGGNQDGNVQAA